MTRKDSDVVGGGEAGCKLSDALFGGVCLVEAVVIFEAFRVFIFGPSFRLIEDKRKQTISNGTVATIDIENESLLALHVPFSQFCLQITKSQLQSCVRRILELNNIPFSR